MNSSIAAFIFDLDGTLVNSNDLQVDAWLASFADHGYTVSRDRIEKEVGKGGDQLVADVLGGLADQKDGDRLRDGQTRHAAALIDQRRPPALPGAIELLRKCRSAGFGVGLATSSSDKILHALLESSGIERASFDQIATADDARQTKPQADIYHAILKKLKLGAAECVNVGDTPYDCIAARRAGLLTIGLDGELNTAKTLRESGARCTFGGCDQLLAHWDEMVTRVAPRRVRLTAEKIDDCMAAALAAAEGALPAGEVPIGAALFDGDGQLLARANNTQNATGDKIAHAEIVAFRAIAGRVDPDATDLILVSTLEPCVMCLGAAMEAGVETVIYGLAAPFDGGAERVTPPTSPESQMPRIVGNVQSAEARALFVKWLKTAENPKQIAFVKQLLSATASRRL